MKHWFQELQFNTTIAAFVGELQRYCSYDYVPGTWHIASAIRALPHIMGEDVTMVIFFHKSIPSPDGFMALPLPSDAGPNAVFLLSDIGGDFPLLVHYRPIHPEEEAMGFVEGFIARCKKLWSMPKPTPDRGGGGVHQDSGRYSYSPKKRKEIVEQYRRGRDAGEILNKHAWVKSTYGITGKTLYNYEKEFPEVET